MWFVILALSIPVLRWVLVLFVLLGASAVLATPETFIDPSPKTIPEERYGLLKPQAVIIELCDVAMFFVGWDNGEVRMANQSDIEHNNNDILGWVNALREHMKEIYGHEDFLVVRPKSSVMTPYGCLVLTDQ